MNLGKIPNLGRLLCPIEYLQEELFFSLVDYRNNCFTSEDPNKIIEFYNGFKTRDQLIQWMKERPKGVATINEVEGEKDVIVVIPTADIEKAKSEMCWEPRLTMAEGLKITVNWFKQRIQLYQNFN